MSDISMPSGLSPSSIDLWDQCPLRFRKEKLEKRTGPPGIDAVRGTFIHLVLEHLMQRPPAERTPRVAATILSTEWPDFVKHNADMAMMGLAEEELTTMRAEAWRSIRTYLGMERPSEVDVVATEQKVTVEFDDFTLRGIIDRLERDVFDDLVVSDYKSGKVPLPQYRAAKFRQLNLYGVMVERLTDERPVMGRLIFTTFGEFVDTPFTDRSLDEAYDAAAETWVQIGHAVKTDEFEPKPGPLCGWCNFVAECPEGLAEIKKRRKAGRLKSSAPAYGLSK